MNDGMMMKGQFEVKVYEASDVVREMEIGDPEGISRARTKAFAAALRGDLSGFAELASLGFSNTIMDAYYDLVFDTMIKGETYVEDMRIGLFGNDVTPSASLTITSFEASLGEATGYTVDTGNTTNRSTTTFAVSDTQSITNSAAPSRFTFTGTDTIYGAMVIQGAPLKSGAGDAAPAVLMAAGKFNASQPVALASIIDVVYTQSKA